LEPSSAIITLRIHNPEACLAKASALTCVLAPASNLSQKGTSEPIEWRYAQEKYVIKSQIKSLAYPLYDRLCKEGRPLESEWSFKVELRDLASDGRRMGLHGRIDEIRPDKNVIVIRDFKTGFLLQRPKIDFYGVQPTEYILATLLTAYHDPIFADKIKLKKEEIPHLLRDDIALKKRIRFDYVMLEGKDYDNNVFIKVTPTWRTSKHFNDLITLIHETWDAFTNGTIEPDLTKDVCNKCPVREICMERAEDPRYKKGEQTKFDFVEMLHRHPNYKKEEQTKIDFVEMLQGVRRVRITVNKSEVDEKLLKQRRLGDTYWKEAKKREKDNEA